jgi:prenyltransferase beta subunit
MWSRRRFLRYGAALSLAGSLQAKPAPAEKEPLITAECQKAIDAGLAFLAKAQHADGSFGTNAYTGNVAITSLTARAFLAGGVPAANSPGAKVVSGALGAVLAQQGNGGPGFLHNPNATPHGPMYGHAFGTLFLADALEGIKDRDLQGRVREALKKAVKLSVDCQNKEGGWRYLPHIADTDISVTACQALALHAAKAAGAEVPAAVSDRFVAYVKSCRRQDGGFGYMAMGGNSGFARTAAAVCVLYAGGVAKGEELEGGLKYLRDNKPAKGAAPARADMHYAYGHYFAVQALRKAGGDSWPEWFAAIRTDLLGRQQKDGSWQDQICTHYATAMACLILQMPTSKVYRLE